MNALLKILSRQGIFYINLFITLSFILSAQKSTAQVNMPLDFTHTLLSNGWVDPVGVLYDANNNGYLWEKKGRVWRINSDGIKQTPVLLDISHEVGNWRAHGMLGFALDPNFITNGYVYCLYIVDRYALFNLGLPGYSTTTNSYNNATIGRLTRYTVNTSTFTSLVPNSRLVLVGETKSTGFPVLHESHGAGSLVFGTDGSLMVSFGDGADYGSGDSGSFYETYYQQALADSIILPGENIGAFRAQSLESLDGKILRINPANGDGLSSNPFYNAANPRSPRSRIWALGFRNPFRMNLMPNTGVTDVTAGDPGTLIEGEVGWATWEETNVITHGGVNCGWPLYEGITKANTYPGYLKYNESAPNPLYGTGGCTQPYFYFQDLIKQASSNSDSAVFRNPCDNLQNIPANIPVFIHQPPAIDWRHNYAYTRVPVLGTDTVIADSINDGLPAIGPAFSGNCAISGPVYNDNRFPAEYQGACFMADYGDLWIKTMHFNSNNEVTSVSSFADSVGSIVFMTIRPQDGCLTYITLPSSLHKICFTGTLNNPPTARIKLLSPHNYGTSPLTLNFSGSLSTDPENNITSYLWEFGDDSVSTAINPTHTFVYTQGVPHSFMVRLTVTDNINQHHTDSLLISINNTPPLVHITSIANNSYYHITFPTYYDLIANVTDSEDSDAQLSYEWQSELHHNNHVHPEPKDTDHITSTIINPDGCDDVFFWDINLVVTDPQGLSGYDTVRVYPKCQLPDVDFVADKTTLCGADTVHFTNNSFNGMNYIWDFGGGTIISSNDNQATVLYNVAGNYTVKLRACNKLGCDTLVKTDYIHVSTTNSITLTNSGNTTFCNGDSITLSVILANAASYQWYKNNNPLSGSNNDSLIVKTSGLYKVVAGSNTGCVFESNILNVVVTQPTVNIGSSSNTICTGGSAILTAQAIGAVSYAWLKNSVNMPGEFNSSLTVNGVGVYQCITTFSSGCTAISNSITITINDPVATLINTGADQGCQGTTTVLKVQTSGALTYQWYKNNTIINNAIDSTFTVNKTGAYKARVTYSGNCSATTNDKNIVISSTITVPLTTNKPNPVCYKDTLTFSVAPVNGATYTWKKNGSLVIAATGPVYKLPVTSDVSVNAKITITGCTLKTPTYNAMVTPNIKLTVSSYTICNDSALISATYDPGYTYIWKKNNIVIPGANSSSYYASIPASYQAIIKNAQNCTGSSTKVNIVNLCRDELSTDLNPYPLIQDLSFEPNPVTVKGSLNFELLNDANLNLSLVDFMGQQIETFNKYAEKGYFNYEFDLSSFSNGIYSLIIHDESGHSWHINIAITH